MFLPNSVPFLFFVVHLSPRRGAIYIYIYIYIYKAAHRVQDCRKLSCRLLVPVYTLSSYTTPCRWYGVSFDLCTIPDVPYAFRLLFLLSSFLPFFLSVFFSLSWCYLPVSYPCRWRYESGFSRVQSSTQIRIRETGVFLELPNFWHSITVNQGGVFLSLVVLLWMVVYKGRQLHNNVEFPSWRTASFMSSIVIWRCYIRTYLKQSTRTWWVYQRLQYISKGTLARDTPCYNLTSLRWDFLLLQLLWFNFVLHVCWFYPRVLFLPCCDYGLPLGGWLLTPTTKQLSCSESRVGGTCALYISSQLIRG